MNAGQTGFYRVNYQTENWHKLVQQLNTFNQVTVIVLLSNFLTGVCWLYCCFYLYSEVFRWVLFPNFTEFNLEVSTVGNEFLRSFS